MTERVLVEKIEIVTPRILIERERRRLLDGISGEADSLKTGLKIDKEYDWQNWWKSESRSGWARRDFGPTLKERTAEEIFEDKHGDISYLSGMIKGYCQVCGQLFGLDERFIVLRFSFCDEYSCEMSIHLNCKKIKKLVAQAKDGSE